MFENTTLAASVLANPASVQSMVLTEFQNRLGGTYSVADPNNSFNLLLEANSSINAQSVRFMESMFDAQYAVRATTSAELYNNMSDFDYLSMVAGPSSTTINLTFNADYLIANARYYDVVYNRVVIPAGSQFYIGPLTFGIYYPINIDINRTTDNINVLWDTTINNPLQTLSTNMVPFVQYSNGGLNLITLTIPVSQFAMSTTIYPVVAQQGFIQSINYPNQFYAARVFTNLPTGSWTELAYTLSETVYDPTTPTAKLTIQNDTNILTVSIPQIYFTNSQIGNQVMVMVYTTEGAIALDLTSVEVSSCNCDFGLSLTEVSPYALILANLATIDLTPAEMSITGGSSALSFTALRNLVINGGLYTSVPVTPAELTAYAAKQGFAITKYIDNVTDRIYYASNTISGGQNGYVMVTTATISVILPPVGSTTGLPSTILNFPTENAVMILPTTIYSYNTQSDLCTPLTDTAVIVLNNMTKAEFATEVNTNSYTKCPFHIVTYTASQYPITKSFDLMNPTASTIRYIADNVELTPQMSLVSAAVIHNNNGTGGYTLRLGVTKTSMMSLIAESDITVYLSVIGSNNDTFYGIATLSGTSGVLYIYELQIPTTYYISQQDTFRSTMLSTTQGIATTVDIPLASTFTVTFLLTPSLYPAALTTQNVNIVNNLATPYNQLLGVCQQQVDVVFGTDLSSHLYNSTNALWTSTTYAVWPETIYQTYPTDVYETDAQGGLVYTVVSGVLHLNKIHSLGDQVLDSSGNPIVLHAIGSSKLDSLGNPITMATRQLNYYVSSMMFDMRLFYSTNQADVTFVSNLTNTLMSYFATLTTIQGNLLEQTSLYYRPNNTMGLATFSAGNNKPISLDLGFSFSFIAYVSQATLDNPTLTSAIVADITSITQSEMTKPIISLTEIADNIKSQLSDTIISLDIEGIDSTTTLQTVIVPAGTISPIIGQQLVYNSATDSLALGSMIQVAFELAA
jgi:hypothetical protein